MRKKLFGIAFLGFDKKDVTSYIDKIVKEYEGKFREKDNEIYTLSNVNNMLKEENNKLLKKLNEIEIGKERIASVLIKANEKADLIMEEAKRRAETEKKEIEGQIEKEKLKLNNIKTIVHEFKGEIIKFSKGFEAKMDDFAGLAEIYIKNSCSREKNVKVFSR